METETEVVDKKECKKCNIKFCKSRDFDNHIKTKKHLNNTLNIVSTKCPYCDYETNHTGNLNKHISNMHVHIKLKIKDEIKEKIKAIKDEKITPKIIKTYLSLLSSNQIKYRNCIALKSGIKRLKSRLFKDDEPIMIKKKFERQEAIKDYENGLKQVEDLLKLYPTLINEKPKEKTDKDFKTNDNSESGSDTDEIIIKSNESLKIDKMLKADKLLKIDMENKEIQKQTIILKIETLRQEYIDSKGTNQKLWKEIEKLERDILSIYT